MTTDPARLLQMLEPAVRPGGVAPTQGASKTQQARAPFEAKSFQTLLSEASLDTAGPGGTAGQLNSQAGTAAASNPLLGLSGLGQIENAGLRQVLNQASQQGGVG